MRTKKCDLSKKIKVLKYTDDNWYSNDIVNGGKIVMVSYLPLSNDEHRVCVWGNDDFGLEFDYKTRKEAMKNFNIIIAMDRVNQQLLKNMGFYNA